MSTPRISSITPCFRMKPYLKLFLEELPKQTIFNDIEIVLDHNEPDEEELQWVREFQARYPGRIKHIITNPVEPIGKSMNTCIKAASAPYLTIWNVDDLRTPNSMELMVQAFDAGADIVYGNFEVVRKFGSTSGSLTDFSEYQSQTEEFTRSMLLGPFMAFRKSLVEKAGYFDEQLKSGADFDLAVRLAFHGKPVMAKGLLGYYLNEGKGASTRPDSKQALDRTAIELRFGIYDKVNYDLIAQATQLDLLHVHVDGQKLPISNFVPNYSALIEERRARWHKIGLRRYLVDKVTQRKNIRRVIGKYVKRARFGI
jgi:GT2 family glycosyltransferase